MGNCLSCRWKGEARTPSCSKKPEWAATCDYPMPRGFNLMGLNITEVTRHINLADILPDSEFYNADHAAFDCPAYASVDVTQEDREETARISELYSPKTSHAAQNMRNGEADDSVPVRAFRRHRLASQKGGPQ